MLYVLGQENRPGTQDIIGPRSASHYNVQQPSEVLEGCITQYGKVSGVGAAQASGRCPHLKTFFSQLLPSDLINLEIRIREYASGVLAESLLGDTLLVVGVDGVDVPPSSLELWRPPLPG